MIKADYCIFIGKNLYPYMLIKYFGQYNYLFMYRNSCLKSIKRNLQNQLECKDEHY